MKKRMKPNGFTVLEFEKGDGLLRRWSDVMQPWRAVSPEKKRLAHPYAWYLEEANLLARPVIGMLSIGRFAEHILWRAMKECPGTRAYYKAARLMRTVQRKMAQLQYRATNGRVRRLVWRQYLKVSVRNLVALAKAAADALGTEGGAVHTRSMQEALA